MIHQLKTTENYFKDITSGNKTFEVRNNDRNFAVGDFLALNEIDESNEYTGRSCLAEVSYILKDLTYCKEGYVTLAIKPCAIRTVRNNVRNDCIDVYSAIPIYSNCGDKQ